MDADKQYEVISLWQATRAIFQSKWVGNWYEAPEEKTWYEYEVTGPYFSTEREARIFAIANGLADGHEQQTKVLELHKSFKLLNNQFEEITVEQISGETFRKARSVVQKRMYDKLSDFDYGLLI